VKDKKDTVLITSKYFRNNMEQLGRQELPQDYSAAAGKRYRSHTSVSPEVETIVAPYHSPQTDSRNNRKRAKTNEPKLTFRLNNRRTKKDYRQELELMNAASDKIMSLNSENAQLRLRLEKAQAENVSLQLALDQERLALERERIVSMDRESSNRTLRLMLLEERVRAENRAQDSRLYQGVSRPPPSLPMHAPAPISRDTVQDRRLSAARGMPVYTPVGPSTNSRFPPREGVNYHDAPNSMDGQPLHSQLTAQRVRSELASVIGKSSG
jgi:hypothetical protein